MSIARDTAHGQAKSPLAGPRPTPPPGDRPEARAARSSGTVFDADPADNPVDLARDRSWLAGLMILLGRLEYGRALLDDPGHAKGGAAAVKVAAALVEEVAGFAIEHADPTAADPAADALARAHQFLTAAHTAAAPKKGLFGLFRGPADAAAGSAAADLFAELPLVLEQYFTLFGAAFRDPAAAVQWVNTSGVFLTELRRALAWATGRPVDHP